MRNALKSLVVAMFISSVFAQSDQQAIGKSDEIAAPDEAPSPEAAIDAVKPSSSHVPPPQTEVVSNNATEPVRYAEYCKSVKLAVKSKESPWRYLGIGRHERVLVCSQPDGLIKVYSGSKQTLLFAYQFEKNADFEPKSKGPLAAIRTVFSQRAPAAA
jgi:hypothetical protein